MGFCSCTVKYFLFFFNFVVVVFGIALIVIGSLAYSRGGTLVDLLDGQVSAPSIAVIVIGVIIFLIAFLGCCGAMQESSCMITTYAVLLLTILIVEMVIGILAFVYHGKFEQGLEKEFETIFENYNNGSQASVDSIQKTFQCCGLKSYKDWVAKNGTTVPDSCCKYKSCKKTDLTDIWTEGCKNKITEDVKTWLKEIGGVAIGFACIEIFGVVFALCLASHIRKGNRGRF